MPGHVTTNRQLNELAGCIRKTAETSIKREMATSHRLFKLFVVCLSYYSFNRPTCISFRLSTTAAVESRDCNSATMLTLTGKHILGLKVVST